MGVGHLQFALDYARYSRPVRELALAELLHLGRFALSEVAPPEALVVESGASASALATGVKTPNRSLAELADGEKPPTILEIARSLGKSVGLVTNGRLTHATAAAFLTHRAQRDDEWEIAREIADFHADVLLGGGSRYFPPSVLARTRKNTGLFEIFSLDSFPYVIDRKDSSSEPELAVMTRKAIAKLSRNPKGFVLIVLGRLVDEASHNNDAAATLGEMLEFDRALRVGLRFAEKEPSTQIVVTSNHDTGGVGLGNRANPPSFGGGDQLELIGAQKASFGRILLAIKDEKDSRSIARIVRSKLAPSAEFSDEDAALVRDALDLGPKKLPFTYSPAMQALGRILSRQYFVVWATGTHTASPVPAIAIGPGTENLGGWIQNTDLFSMMRRPLEAGVHQ